MEQGLKIAFWMCFLIGYLHAGPVPQQTRTYQLTEGDLGITFLQNEVKCENKNFTSLKNTGACRPAAILHFIGELERAKSDCKDDNDRIEETLGAWKRENKQFPCIKTSTCSSTLETEPSQFDGLVDAIEKFAQSLNVESFNCEN